MINLKHPHALMDQINEPISCPFSSCLKEAQTGGYDLQPRRCPLNVTTSIPGEALFLESSLSLLKKQLMSDCRNLYQCSILQSGCSTNGQSDLLKGKYVGGEGEGEKKECFP